MGVEFLLSIFRPSRFEDYLLEMIAASSSRESKPFKLEIFTNNLGFIGKGSAVVTID